MSPTIYEYNDFPNIIYMTSDNRWDPSNIQLTHHSSVIGTLKCSHSDKYTDNSEYDIITGSVYSIYTSRLAEGLSYQAATVLAITTNERHYKVDDKIVAQRWSIGLDPAQYTLKTTIQVGVRHAVYPLTHWYNTDLIHG